MEKHISFSVSIKKEHNNCETITYKINFIDSCRFMPSKLSDFVEELTKKIDGNNLIFTTISTGKTNDSTKKDDPLTFLNKIKKEE